MIVTYSVKQKILFKHCDPAGIVFFPRYFEMINDCVEGFFGEILNMPFERLHKTGGVPTVAIQTTFPAASRHGDVLDITLVPTRVGRTSLQLSLTATCMGEVRFQSRSTLVLVDANGRPEAWPEAVRGILKSNLGEPDES